MKIQQEAPHIQAQTSNINAATAEKQAMTARELEAQQAEKQFLNATNDKDKTDAYISSQMLRGKPIAKQQGFPETYYDEKSGQTLKGTRLINNITGNDEFKIGQQEQQLPVLPPQDVSKREIGKVYTDVQGRNIIWDGKGWKLSSQTPTSQSYSDPVLRAFPGTSFCML